MNNNTHTAATEPVIRPIPTIKQFTDMVDTIISPEVDCNDEQAGAFINIVLTLADETNPYTHSLAQAAARHAFSKTRAFELAFQGYAQSFDSVPYRADRFVVQHAPREM